MKKAAQYLMQLILCPKGDSGHNYEPTLHLNYFVNLHTEPSESKGYLPIIDGQLIDKDNYFGFGEKIEWEKFKSQILETVNEIKSW